MLGLNQRHALEAFRTSVGDENGHIEDCILALRATQAKKAVKINPHLSLLENLLSV